MLIGVPKEIKPQEARIGLTPESVHELRWHGHKVIVERNAGIGIGESDANYRKAGATIVKDAKAVFAKAEMIVKVKEPQPSECRMLQKGQVLFTYLHLAANRKLTEALMRSGATCIAYETVTAPNGSLPLLTPMSRIAGRLAPQAGAQCLLKHMGGEGRLMSGGGGVSPVRVLVIGAGVVGMNAAMIAKGMGADVVIMDKSLDALDRVESDLNGVVGLYSTRAVIAEEIKRADMVIGAVLVPGAAAPKLVSRSMLKVMRPGAVLVDVAIDQGGCFSTSRATTHDKPVYVVNNILHYCVANMPGAVPNTASYALNHATLPYVLRLAKGVRKSLVADEHLRNGLSVSDGKLNCVATSRSLRIKHQGSLAAVQ